MIVVRRLLIAIFGLGLGFCPVLTATVPARTGEVPLPLIRPSPDGHFLATADGAPFFWLGDTAWDLFQRPSREDVDVYLADRASKGFTVIQAVIGGAAGHQGPNHYGERPFIDNDPARPNEAYFAHVDHVIARARHFGLHIAIVPYWANAFQYSSGIVGRASPLIPVNFDAASAEAYGRWLGDRYRDRNILWILGGDINPIWPARRMFQLSDDGIRLDRAASDLNPRDWRPLYDAWARGLRLGEGRDSFITYHPTCCTFAGMPEPRTSQFFGDRDWLTINMIQSSHSLNPAEVTGARLGWASGWLGLSNYDPIRREYDSRPVRPIIDGEPLYEDLGRDNDRLNVSTKGYWTGDEARNAAYQALFAGAAGHTYGNHAIWQFAGPDVRVDPPLTPGLTWHEALQRPVSSQLRHLRDLMLSRPYFTRLPDHAMIVGDAGEGRSHIAGTRDARGRYAMIYIPDGRPATIALSSLNGAVLRAWWFDPRNGTAHPIERTIRGTGTRLFVPPTRGTEEDWVLVLDDMRQGYPPPGLLYSSFR